MYRLRRQGSVAIELTLCSKSSNTMFCRLRFATDFSCERSSGSC